MFQQCRVVGEAPRGAGRWHVSAMPGHWGSAQRRGEVACFSNAGPPPPTDATQCNAALLTPPPDGRRLTKRWGWKMASRLALAALVGLVTVSFAAPASKGQTAPLTLDGLVAKHGSELVGDKWLAGLKDLQYLMGSEPAYEVHLNAAKEAIKLYESGNFHQAALRFGEVFRAVVATPTGSDLDSIWAAILFRAREVAWRQAIEECTRKVSFENPPNYDMFKAVFLTPAIADMKRGESFKAHCRYNAAFEYLVIKGEEIGESFPAAEQEAAGRQLMLGRASSLAAAKGREFSILQSLNGVKLQLPQITNAFESQETKGEVKLLLEALQDDVEFSITGFSLRANVAWLAAQTAQQKGNLERYVTALRLARDIAAVGVSCETLYAELSKELGRPVGRSVEIHRLSASLNQGILQVLLPQAQSADPQTEAGVYIMLEANQAIEAALTSLAMVVDHDAKDWGSRLVLAQLVLLQKGRDSGKGPLLSGDTATMVAKLVQSAQEIGTNEAECQFNAGSILRSARLGDPRPAFQRFLQLAPNDPRVPEIKAYLDSIKE
jgi:hypothetical protein